MDGIPPTLLSTIGWLTKDGTIPVPVPVGVDAAAPISLALLLWPFSRTLWDATIPYYPLKFDVPYSMASLLLDVVICP
jgi:hypothetical protein